MEITSKLQRFKVDSAQLMSGKQGKNDFLRRVFDRCSSVEIFHINMTYLLGGYYIKSINRVTGPLKIDELTIHRCYAGLHFDFHNDWRVG